MVQARVAQSGVDVVAGNVVALLQAVLGQSGGGPVVLDTSQLLGTTAFKLQDGLGLFSTGASVRDLQLTFDLQSVQVDLVEGSAPARVRITFDHATIGVVQGVIAGETGVLGATTDAACHLQNGLGVGTPDARLAVVSGAFDLVLGVDGAGKLAVTVDVAPTTLHEVGFALKKDCGLQECTDKVLLEPACLECELCATGVLANAAAQLGTTLLEPVLDDLLGAIGNLIVERLLGAALNGKVLDLEVPLDVRGLVSEAVPLLQGLLGETAGPLRVRVRPAPQQGDVHAFRVVDAGLVSRLDASVFSAAAPCVVTPGEDGSPVFAALPIGPVPPVPDKMTIQTPQGLQDQPVDVALLVGRPLIEELVWSMTRSGLFCIRIDSAALHQLSGGSLLLTAGAVDLVLPGLQQLAGPDAAVRLTVRPSAWPGDVPRVQLAQDGQEVVLSATLRNVGVSMEADVRDRWLGIVDLSTDLTLRAAIQIDAGVLVLRVLGLDLSQIKVADGLFDGAQLAAAAPALAKVVVNLLLSQPIRLELDLGALVQQLLQLPVDASLLGVKASGDAADWLLVGLGLSVAGPP
jgi:hypothetical protein